MTIWYLKYLNKFADDTKLISAITTVNKTLTVWDRIYKCNLASWSEEWMMLFNIEKCHAIHMCKDNRKAKYYVPGKQLVEVRQF